jgi:hypothetical protein
MRLPVEGRYVLNLAAWAIGFVGFVRAAIWIPLSGISPMLLTCVAIGIAPLTFFDNRYRNGYLCFCLLMSGAGGLLVLGGQRLNCLIGTSCTETSRSTLVVAIPVYVVLGAVGLIWMRRITRSSKPATPP